MHKKLINSNWTMRRADSDESIPAQVPGSVYEDLLRNGRMDDPFWKDNEIEALRLMDHDYEYETIFDAEEEYLRSDETIIRFEGLDTLADVYLNDDLILTDNFFDMNAGMKEVEVLSGSITDLRLRSVYDIS